MDFSIIVPVFNRPQEVDELLASLTAQSKKEFEVIIVEDGSSSRCLDIISKYSSLLDIKYFYKNNSGPGLSRNFGFDNARGNYAIFLDSDCVLPPQYFEVVQSSLNNDFVDAFGGPDMAHKDFSDLQKAINYSMTSFLTTGGIRGGSEKIDKFYPRSFNMGYSREVYKSTGGFSNMRFGEDIDMSIRILNKGFKTKLIKEAFVFHKRRTSLKQFFKQVYNSGIARINLYKRYPTSLKAVHALPSLFTLGSVFLILMAIFVHSYFLYPLNSFILLLFLDAAIKNKSIYIGALSVVTSFYQLFGYGSGFILAFYKRLVLKQDEFVAFKNNFYT
ncbi:MAG: glycosyltransferase [Bacteroidia bacterium]|nr:glycosyltransferase [Bacteroidia bacterium]